jgi:hypothetical protein
MPAMLSDHCRLGHTKDGRLTQGVIIRVVLAPQKADLTSRSRRSARCAVLLSLTSTILSPTCRRCESIPILHDIESTQPLLCTFGVCFVRKGVVHRQGKYPEPTTNKDPATAQTNRIGRADAISGNVSKAGTKRKHMVLEFVGTGRRPLQMVAPLQLLFVLRPYVTCGGSNTPT